MDLVEEFLDDLPENERRSFVVKRDRPSIPVLVDRVLKVGPAEIRVVLVLVPAGVESRVRVAEVDPEPVVGLSAIPLDVESGFLGSGRWLQAVRIEPRSQSSGLDGVLTIPKVPLYGVWKGNEGGAWQREQLQIDCRSPKVEPLIERDLAILGA